MAPKFEGPNFAALPAGGKVFVLFTMLALLSGAYYFGFHMGLEDDTASARARHATLQTQLQEAAERQKDFLELREELASREAIDQQNLRILPMQAEIPGFLDDLNRLTELSGLKVKQVSPTPERAEELYFRVPVQLQLEGRYHQLAKFFYNVSRLERAINMENISIVSNTAEGEEIPLTVNVLATTFRRREES